MSGRKILLIEDEMMLSKLYGDMLGHKGHRIQTAGNVKEALEVLKSGLPELILSDIMMPDIDGIEGCQMIREEFGDAVPVIFVSALDDSETMKRAFDSGGDDYLTKQSSLEDVVNRVEMWLETSADDRTQQTARFRGELLG